MNLVKSPIHCQDIAACFATVTNSTLDEVFKFCGHDGRQIIWPKLDLKLRRRSFHIQEMVDFCLSKNYFITPISRRYLTLRMNETKIVAWEGKEADVRFYNYLNHYYGVLSGPDHFCVWDGKKIHDVHDGHVYDYPIEKDDAYDMFMITAKV